LLARPEIQFGFVSVMCPAAKLDIVDGRLPARPVGYDVVELQETPLCAPAAVLGHKRASAPVALPYLPPDGSGNVARA